jgi:hypothetical protein
MECSVARPSNAQGYWSWRLIDGRKCWYAGKTMISKSLLQWPAKASVQAKADTTPAPANRRHGEAQRSARCASADA